MAPTTSTAHSPPAPSLFLLEHSSTTTSISSHNIPLPSRRFPYILSTTLLHNHPYIILFFNMGKTHKMNDRDHAGLADGTASPTEHLPRYFAKSGHVDVDPKKAKKNGAGKGGWGVNGEEVQDEGFNMANSRRRSNSSSYTAGLKDFKTKFEQIETDPVFEEDIHGAVEEDAELPDARRVNTESSVSSNDDDEKKSL
ncbi:hypothetical protein BJ875DRAFT_453424 [Amylocarpus encephaloides]|uniref:Hyaluronan/mRNA-binding protein domain-containing protein n=1 Tax=Amylocarpus encephaloides TaxID=45428 RepID=A0A9P8C8L5_9HELO|nr:hypothetical protein BJ875DRAFT_453424 [Amylocarpus encephaloides]